MDKLRNCSICVPCLDQCVQIVSSTSTKSFRKCFCQEHHWHRPPFVWKDISGSVLCFSITLDEGMWLHLRWVHNLIFHTQACSGRAHRPELWNNLVGVLERIRFACPHVTTNSDVRDQSHPVCKAICSFFYFWLSSHLPGPMFFGMTTSSGTAGLENTQAFFDRQQSVGP